MYYVPVLNSILNPKGLGKAALRRGVLQTVVEPGAGFINFPLKRLALIARIQAEELGRPCWTSKPTLRDWSLMFQRNLRRIQVCTGYVHGFPVDLSEGKPKRRQTSSGVSLLFVFLGHRLKCIHETKQPLLTKPRGVMKS